MPWVVTLQIVDCASAGTNLSFASINDGYTIHSADANGQFIAIVDDVFTGYVVNIGKSGYLSRNFALANTMNGTTQNVCLNERPPRPPGESTGGSGW
jgi:hypothetical protein